MIFHGPRRSETSLTSVGDVSATVTRRAATSTELSTTLPALCPEAFATTVCTTRRAKTANNANPTSTGTPNGMLAESLSPTKKIK